LLELHIFPLIGTILATDLNTADLLIPLQVAERKGNLKTAARIQQLTTAIMRYALQESLNASSPANDLTEPSRRRRKTTTPPCRLKRCPNYWSGWKFKNIWNAKVWR